MLSGHNVAASISVIIRDTITINVPLFKKLRDIIFFIYRDIIYDFISQYHPPPQTTAIYGDFKKSTAISKGYNVGLRYIKIDTTLGIIEKSKAVCRLNH